MTTSKISTQAQPINANLPILDFSLYEKGVNRESSLLKIFSTPPTRSVFSILKITAFPSIFSKKRKPFLKLSSSNL